VGADRTDSTGVFNVVAPLRSGTYYVIAKKKNIGSRGHKHICKQDRSPTVEVAP
jgi:hypothetical protein